MLVFESICEHLQSCRDKLDAIDNREERLQELAEEERARKAELKIAAAALSAARKKAAPKLQQDLPLLPNHHPK